jgi:4-hydroxybutyryl-CoA dehydratase/vinylacetyl-CoA-Delta-isomerase
VRSSEAITDAKGHRRKRPSQQDDPDAYLRVVDRQSDGIVIRGAKLHITGAPLVHEQVVLPTKSMKPGEEQYAVACSVPSNAPGPPHRQHDQCTARRRPAPLPDQQQVEHAGGPARLRRCLRPERARVPGRRDSHAASLAHALGSVGALQRVATAAAAPTASSASPALLGGDDGAAGRGRIKDMPPEMAIYATMCRAGWRPRWRTHGQADGTPVTGVALRAARRSSTTPSSTGRWSTSSTTWPARCWWRPDDGGLRQRRDRADVREHPP